MQEPAKAEGVTFTDDAARRLANDLRTVRVQQADGTTTTALGLHIEPVQLQVVCRRLWENLPPDDNEISEDDVENVGDVDDALRNYYADRVADIAAKTGTKERLIREWFDNELITEQGIRGQVLQGKDSSQGLDNDAIWPLVGAHVVRAEQRRGATWFELAHDRLIEPVRTDNAVWRDTNLSALQRQAALWEKESRPNGLLVQGDDLHEAETWAAAKKDGLEPHEIDFLDASRKAQEAAKREKRQSRLIKIASVVAMGLAVAAIILFFNAQNSAIRAKNAAEIARVAESKAVAA